MTLQQRLRLTEIEHQVCDITSEQLGIPRQKVTPHSRLIQDLHCDSLDIIELIMEMEESFDIRIPDNHPNSVYKAVFTRQPFRLADLAELVYLQQGTGQPQRHRLRMSIVDPKPGPVVPFSQLDGIWQPEQNDNVPAFEKLETNEGPPQYRRRIDGMRCLLIPAADVEIGFSGPAARADEQPQHVVGLDAFLIDAEPVSTTAYCRFLNSIFDVSAETLAEFFILDSSDDRVIHMPVEQQDRLWQPIAGTEHWPMILVSWYGANAYSLWANGRDWRGYRHETEQDGESFLPSEAQWEYAARGAKSRQYPWGEEAQTQQRMNFGRHRESVEYQVQTLPLSAVNEQLGMSPFGLHHVAGNVWQWCRDWYDENFYRTPEATAPNPVNRTAGQVRSERGGSWVGPAELCRSSFRRGRAPYARGRCLGFRCISPIQGIDSTDSTWWPSLSKR